MKNLYQRLKPLGRILEMGKEGWTIWDCCPIYGEDGQVHVFFTRWKGLDQPDAIWFMGSQIVHAVAENVQGPYKILDVVIEGKGGAERWDASGVINPKIYRVESQYVLVYTGCQQQRHDTQAVGMLVSDSLYGPWKRVSEGPLIRPGAARSGFDGYLCNNPALLVHPNGEYWIYYKGRTCTVTENGEHKAGEMSIGLATSRTLTGPYTKVSSTPVLELDRSMEDPYVWYDGSRFWMILSELGHREPAGLLFSSEDGIQWSPSEPAYPSPGTFLGKDMRLEEPNLLFDQGRPTHLFHVLGGEGEGYSGFVFEIGDVSDR